MKHRWNTSHYEKYTKSLWRTDLHKLYHSESWAMYRTILKSNNCLDLGCGNGAMSKIVNKINKNCNYTGVDHQENLINIANKIFKPSKFIFQDVTDFVATNKKKYDAVMAWSVIKSFSNWKELIKLMIKTSKKYVVFDQRVTNYPGVHFDQKILKATYGKISGPLLSIDYKNLKKYLMQYKRNISRLEIMAYNSNWGKNVTFYKNYNTYVATILIEIKSIKTKNKKFELYEQVPESLIK